MPLLDTEAPLEDRPEATFPRLAQASQEPSPSLTDIAGAAARESFGGLYNYVRSRSFEPHGDAEPGFNPVDHIPGGGPSSGGSYLHDYGSEFLQASNPQQIQVIKDRVNRRAADQATMARGGVLGFAASMAAGATDPLNLAVMALVPEAAPTRLGNALRFGLTNAAVTAGQEGLEGDGTAKSALLNISANAVLGGVLGSIAPRVPRAQYTAMRDAAHEAIHGAGDIATVAGEVRPSIASRGAIEPEITTPEASEVEPKMGDERGLGTIPPAIVNPTEESTAGAMRVHAPNGDDLTVALGARSYARTVGQMYPDYRILNRESSTAKQLLLNLADVKATLTQNYKGIANPDPIEARLFQYDGVRAAGIKQQRASYDAYAVRMNEEGTPAISRKEFDEATAHAMRNNDVSPIKEVASAARWARANIIEPLAARAQKSGLLPDEVKVVGAPSYLTRLYDRQKIKANNNAWMETLRQGFIRQGLSPEDALDIADKVDRRIMGGEAGRMDWHAMDEIVPKAGPLKERTLNLPDKDLEPFLNNDINHVLGNYIRTMAPEVEMTERFGSRDMRDQLQEVSDEYSRKMAQAKATGDNDRVNALRDERKKNLADLEMLRDRIYGIFGEPKDPGYWSSMAGRIMSGMRFANAARLLGWATFKHLPDVANMIARYGTTNTFGAMARLASSLDGIKLATTEAHRFGAALDMVFNSTASLLGDYGSHSQFAEQRFLSKAARVATTVSGETPLITWLQKVTSAMGSDEVLRVAERLSSGNRVNANRLANLARAGLNEDMLKRIAAEYAEHGRTLRGLKFGLSDQWTDRAAARAFESAVVREAHAVTLRPGIADTPGFMSQELWKTIFQFKTFGFAAGKLVTSRLGQGLAHGDARAAQGLLATIAAGVGVAVMRRKMSGEPVETDPQRLAVDALQNSNLTGWLGDLVYPSLWQSGFTNERVGQWAASSLGGPSLELAEQALEHRYPARLANLMSGGAYSRSLGQEPLPFRRSDLHFLRTMAPFQSTWWLRNRLDDLEDIMGDGFDLPGKSQETLATERANRGITQ